MLMVCVRMSLSVYLHHKRIHKNSMLWGTRWIWSCLSYKILEITECWLMIYSVPLGTETTLWSCESSCQDNYKEMHFKTLHIQTQLKMKLLPEVCHQCLKRNIFCHWAINIIYFSKVISFGLKFCFYFFMFVVLFGSWLPVWFGTKLFDKSHDVLLL